MVRWHLEHRPGYDRQALDRSRVPHQTESPDLYRIFFYDCPPLAKKMHLPVSKQAIDLSRTPVARTRLAIHDYLQTRRKVALRLGRLNDTASWRLTPDATKRLIADHDTTFADDDFIIDTKQKGVDMKLGLDVASMAFNKQVDQIILVAADADFVPAIKLARRQGIDVVLETMGASPADDLYRHADGVRNCRRQST